MEKIKERTGQYEVSVRITSNGYYEARVSFKLGGVSRSERLSKGGKSQELAVLNLLTALDSHIDTCYKSGIIITKIDDSIPQRLVKSINELGIITPEITARTLAIVNKISTINANIQNTIPANIIPFYNPNIRNAVAPAPALVPTNINYNLDNTNVPKKEQEICIIEDLVDEWHLYRLSLCKKTEDNPKPLSQTTIDSDYDRFDKGILPYFKQNKILYLKQVTDETIKSLLKSIKSQHDKHKSYIVLNMLFEYAIDNNKTNFNPLRKVDKPPEKLETGEEEIDDNYIEPENQDTYWDKFKETNTDMSILFGTMLKTGIRPEEACRFKVESIRP